MLVMETSRLLMRQLTDDDYARLHSFAQSPRYHRFIGGAPPPLAEFVAQQRERWTNHYRAHGYGQWAVVRREDGVMIGRCGLIVQQVDGADEVEVGYALGEAYWGHGYIIEAAQATRDWSFRNLAVDHLISLIHPDNARSIAVAERNGMSIWKEAEFRGDLARVYRITRPEWQRSHPQAQGSSSLR
jgi:ribosomal-protein-alanine N-acetyltransferase